MTTSVVSKLGVIKSATEVSSSRKVECSLSAGAGSRERASRRAGSILSVSWEQEQGASGEGQE